MISFSAFLSVKSTPPFPWLCNLIMSGQDTWIFGADLFCRWGTVDVVAIPLTFLNSIVLNVCPKTYIEPPCRNTSTQNRLSSSFGQQVSSAFLSFRAVSLPNKPPSKSFTISMEMLKKLSKKSYSDYSEGIQSSSMHHLVPDFLPCSLFYPSTSQTDKGILFH